MKFSILVPVYNVAQYLEQCVESLLNQTYEGEYEIILVDDGSTDSSGKICDKYSEEYPEKVKVIHKKNEGLVSARQVGIEAATGEFCLFVDSDDFVEESLLKEVFSAIDEENQTDVLIYSFNYFRNGNKVNRKKTLSESKSVYSGSQKKCIYEALISTPLITSLWTKAVKTDILKSDPTEYGLYYDKNMAEDWFRTLQILTMANKIVYINSPLYNYRTNDESISRSYKPETIARKNILYVYDKFLKLLPVWGMNDEEHIQKLNARWLNEVMYTFSSYYENVSLKDRKAILEYNWSSMLPEAVLSENNNPHENPVSRSLLSNLNDKNFFYIKIHFLKKRARKFIKKLLKRGI